MEREEKMEGGRKDREKGREGGKRRRREEREESRRGGMQVVYFVSKVNFRISTRIWIYTLYILFSIIDQVLFFLLIQVVSLEVQTQCVILVGLR